MKFQNTRSRFGSAQPVTPAAPSPVDDALSIVRELSHAQSADAAENQRRLDATDSEHWFAVDFETREQKDALLSALGLDRDGDKYLDGRDVARRLAVMLEDREVCLRAAAELRSFEKLRRPAFRAGKVNRRLRGLT